MSDQGSTKGPSREESFLDLYMEYTQNQEAPDSFHLWTALTVLASAMGRKCFLNKGYYRLYPNLFVVLVAGSAICRKSTAIRLGIISPDEVHLFGEIETTKIYQGSITPEQFTRELSEGKKPDLNDPTLQSCPNVLIHSSELAVFLKKQSYAEPLINILTDLFDCPSYREYKTKNKGIDVLVNPFICILAGTTPDGIAHSIPPSALKEGFASRVTWVYEPTTNRIIALPELSERQRELSIRIKTMLEERSRLSGEFFLSPEAKTAYIEWYEKYIRVPAPDKYLEGMYSRKHDQLLRLGIIIAGNYLTNIIQPEHLDAALSMLDAVEVKASAAFTQLGGNDSTPHLIRARGYIQRFGRIQHSELLRKMTPCDARMFNGTIMPTLLQSGEVEMEIGTRTYIWKG